MRLRYLIETLVQSKSSYFVSSFTAPDRVSTVLSEDAASVRLGQSSDKPIVLGHPAVLFVGSLHSTEGLAVLLAAFDSIFEQVPNVSLHILGAISSESRFKALASSLRASSLINFHGDRPDVRAFIRAADILVMPSLTETSRQIVSEACEAGCAIVASRVDSLTEMLDGGCAGSLVPPGNAAALATVLFYLLSEPALLEIAKIAARDNATRMTGAKVAAEIFGNQSKPLHSQYS